MSRKVVAVLKIYLWNKRNFQTVVGSYCSKNREILSVKESFNVDADRDLSWGEIYIESYIVLERTDIVECTIIIAENT